MGLNFSAHLKAIYRRLAEITAENSHQVNTLALLKAMTIPSYARSIYMLGRTGVSDGGEGMFVYDTTDHSTATGTGFVDDDPLWGIYVPPDADTTGASGAWVRITRSEYYPQFWGAIGDGVADDSAPLQAAIDKAANETLIIPKGTYYLNGTRVDITEPTTVLMDTGVIISQAGHNTAAVLLADTDSVHLYGRGAQILADRVSAGVNVMAVRGVQNSTIDGIHFRYARKDNINFSSSLVSGADENDNITVNNCKFDTPRRLGISIVNGKRIRIVGSHFTGMLGEAPQAGIDVEFNFRNVESTELISVVDCDFDNIVNGAGVYFATAVNSNVTGCNFLTCGSAVQVQSVYAACDIFAIASVDTGTDVFTTDENHGLAVDDIVRFARHLPAENPSAELPSPIVTSIWYRVLAVPNLDEFTLCTYAGGFVPIDVLSTGTLPFNVAVRDPDITSGISISGCTAENCDSSAFIVKVAYDVNISGCVATYTDGSLSAFNIDQSDRVVIDGCQISKSTDGEGMYLSGKSISVTGGFIRGCPDEAIRAYGCVDPMIANVTIANNGTSSGIDTQCNFRYISGGSFSDCDVKGGQTYAIDMHTTDVTGMKLSDNNMKDSCSSNENTFYQRGPGNFFSNNVLDDGVLYDGYYGKTSAYDPGNLVDGGASILKTVVCTGATLGLEAKAWSTIDLEGVEMTAYVSQADEVTVVLSNTTGGDKNLGEMDLMVAAK